MKVWVLMGNDFPEAVYANEAAGKKEVERRKSEEALRKGMSRIYWRLYAFDLIEA